ncbi:MAG: [citrate (pro-3S)-lyase] ligase [Oscillospiraceae bacterium]
MEYSDFYEEFGSPFSGRKKQKLVDFLAKEGLTYDEQIENSVNLVDGTGEIAASCSLHANVLKCIAVSDKYQGYGLSPRVVTLMSNIALEKDITHLFLFTKPKNKQMFSDLAFYPIMETDTVLLMENTRDGIVKYIDSLEKGEKSENIGAIVMNCNPFTNGHRYLIQTAASECDTLHLFVLSEDKSEFSAQVRYDLVQKGVRDIPNVIVHKTSDYLISSAVFPTYFIKEKSKAEDANCELDLKIFCEYFAKKLNITKRFVGTEPNCQVTNAYNEKMKQILPQYGIEVIEVQRIEAQGRAISASTVREYLHKGDIEKTKDLVPQSTYEYLQREGYLYKK